MGLLSIDEIRTLATQPQGSCISIYLPTVSAGAETQQNPIRFKNLMRQAEAQLQELDLRRTDAVNLLQPAMELDREDFWQSQDQGLALFIAEGFFRYYQLPIPVAELVVVSDRFHVKPLLPLLSDNREFLILTLSQQQIRLFEATARGIHQVDVPNLPQSLEETLQYDETAKTGQFRISTSKGGTSNPFPQAGSYHGQGSPDRDEHQNAILQFFHAVDAALEPVLHDRRAPLVLTGVEYLLPLYREANTYAYLVEEGVPENLDLLRPEELQARVWPIVEPYFAQAEQTALAHYREMTATGKTSTDLKETIPAAYYGRVDQLFVAVGVQQWGSFDPDANNLQMHPQAEPGDEDLLNAAAIATILNGGTVYAVPPDQVPDSAPLAAVFRY